MSRTQKTVYRHVLLQTGLCFLILFTTGGALMAQALPQLFTPIVGNLIADATPEQNRQLDQIRNNATTQSVELVRINLDALKGAQLRITVPNDGSFDLSKTGGTARSDQDFTWSGAVP